MNAAKISCSQLSVLSDLEETVALGSLLVSVDVGGTYKTGQRCEEERQGKSIPALRSLS